jgi:cysteinyl-tRNA synthetase
MLKVFNTLTGRKDSFEPLVPDQVRMYVCGVTVYDYSHLGHARSALVFDVIRNYLRFSGYAVKYVKNFTDVDDKIINRASEEGKTSAEIAETYLRSYQEDMKRLGVVEADVEPKATEHIPDIITMIQTLIAKGHAYRLNGDVYYEVKTYPAYGRLSKRKTEDLLAGARVEVDERKRNPMDFALWKSSKPGEPAWDSPWGPGRPGWHIECSAMSMKHLGDTFDIHGGGQDLIFPHHENEIAQSCAATGKEFARYWLHNGFVQINQEKMSKSLGNFFTVREIFEKFPANEKVTAEIVRYFLLSTQYRGPIDFSDEALRQARAGLNNFYNLFLRLEEKSGSKGVADKEAKGLGKDCAAAFEHAMDDDFNTPVAIAEFQRLRGELNAKLPLGLSQGARHEAYEVFRRLGQVLGLFQVPVRDWEFGTAFSDDSTWSQPIVQPTVPPKPPIRDGQDDLPGDAAIERQIAERNEARRNKDFARADAIRKELAAKGITLEDRPDGTTRWKR